MIREGEVGPAELMGLWVRFEGLGWFMEWDGMGWGGL